MIERTVVEIVTRGRAFHDLTPAAATLARDHGGTGLLHAFVRHTSASLLITENADPTVRDDLERFMARLVPDGDALFRHDAEGPDDMPAHVRSVLTATAISLPIAEGRLLLGTWQGLYLWEHRLGRHRRQVVLTVLT
ncbi:MAG: YjbQ family protein [Planctomycetes bacterium]|nr:YjbQ family protein [Planctomycetota bacterium]